MEHDFTQHYGNIHEMHAFANKEIADTIPTLVFSRCTKANPDPSLSFADQQKNTNTFGAQPGRTTRSGVLATTDQGTLVNGLALSFTNPQDPLLVLGGYRPVILGLNPWSV